MCHLEKEENECTDEEDDNGCNYVHVVLLSLFFLLSENSIVGKVFIYSVSEFWQNKTKTRRRSSSQISRTSKTELRAETKKSDHFRLLPCQSGPKNVIKNNSMRKEENVHLPLSDLSKAISAICSSDSTLSEC